MGACTSIFWLLAAFVTLHMIRGQCTQSSCTEQCFPNLWERDLCHFYLQVSSWRASAEQCGLSLPNPPVRSTLLSPQMQWNRAKDYWEQMRSVWQQAAMANGVPVPSPPEEDSSGNLPTLSPESMASGSGQATALGPSTTPMVATQGPQSTEWLASTASWKNDYIQWESFARSESGLQLPDSIVCDIVDRFNDSVQASIVRENSAAWYSLLNNWRQGYDTYTGTFSGLCPNI